MLVVVLLLPLVPAPAAAQQPTSSPFYEKCAMADPPEPTPKSCESPACTELYTQDQHRTYARAIYKRQNVTRSAQRRVRRMRTCQHSYTAKVNARRLTRRLRNRYQERRQRRLAYLAVRAVLDPIAACESHGNPRAVSASGTYRGKYQFSFATWASVGGRGDPAAASEAEQDYRAAKLLRTGGRGHWPVCG